MDVRHLAWAERLNAIMRVARVADALVAGTGDQRHPARAGLADALDQALEGRGIGAIRLDQMVLSARIVLLKDSNYDRNSDFVNSKYYLRNRNSKGVAAHP